jgi:hypothetical protein
LGPPPSSAAKFAVGERVNFGAFDGDEALHAGEANKRRKAHVLVCLLNRQVMVEIAADALAASAPSLMTH